MIRLACKLTWLSRVSMQSCLQLKDWVALHWRDFYLYQQFSETGKKNILLGPTPRLRYERKPADMNRFAAGWV